VRVQAKRPKGQWCAIVAVMAAGRLLAGGLRDSRRGHPYLPNGCGGALRKKMAARSGQS